MGKTPRKAVLVAIGTELTEGQILNRNAAWISERLTRHGFEVTQHLTTPDDRGEVRAALDYAASRAGLIVVTGGLGPTTDDFTRECLAEWAGRKLEFRDSAWQKIVRLLEGRGVEVAPSNRTQAYFPEGAEVLENLEGTADGFHFSVPRAKGAEGELRVVAVPGPPREGEYLWNRFVERWLDETFGTARPPRLETWHCLGKSESALGEIVERVAKGFGVKTGYRASAPYVEVKIWIPEGMAESSVKTLIDRMDGELKAFAVTRNGEDLGDLFLRSLEECVSRLNIRAVKFFDLGSEGILSERLLGMLKTEAGRRLQSQVEIHTRYADANSGPVVLAAPDEFLFKLRPHGETTVRGPHGESSRTLATPYAQPALADRLRRYHAEMAIRVWTEILAETCSGTAWE